MIFLIADPMDMTKFRDVLSCHDHYKIATGTFKRLVQNFSNPKELKIIGYCCEILTSQRYDELKEIRTKFPHVKMMLLADQIVLTIYKNLLQIGNISIYQKNSLADRIQSAVSEIMTKEHVLPHINETFFTNQRVRIVVTRTGQFMESTLRSYSATNAFLEYKGIAIQKGDHLQIGFTEDEGSIFKHSQQIKAIVLSLTTQVFETPQKGIEVKIILN